MRTCNSARSSTWGERDATYKKKERKELGDVTCDKKYFEIFIQHYMKKMDRVVVYLEKGKYEEYIKYCDTCDG
jgi:hypothetical protein